MSEHRIDLVEISLPEPAAPRRAAEVTQWLLATGVIEVNSDRDDLWQPSEYRAGPRVEQAAPGFERPAYRDAANNGVDVIAGRGLYHPYENYEPPDCPACGAPIDGELHTGLIESWLLAAEPEPVCERCGHRAPLGDWVAHGDEFGGWTFHVAELAVSFNNWPALSASFAAELGGRLGPRWRVVAEHR
ncbi:hypothetical protein [Paractinoplanes atraurantiacus]|uniref:Uncharacterized protein n=1 Tax=Paractinoplanes atraurantiacus TaxID=1036182 RepID=A0A285JQ12_9ACTN|nr:hypothetical protein [Actinoplanes atraurantiacus]SNY61161.1 hypothetical protein SAMN05421748_12298 [Actinoplanes atraurantiacus]